MRDKGIEPTVVEYLKTPPDAKTLKKVIKLLEIKPFDLLRKKEKPFAELGLADLADDNQALIDHMVAHPVLIERPIVVTKEAARIGRPPENVLEIL